MARSSFVNGDRYVVRTLRSSDGTLAYYVQDTWQGYCTAPTPRKRDAQADRRSLNDANERRWA